MDDKFALSAMVLGGATAAITATWSKLRAMLSRLWSIGIVEVKISGTLARAVKAYAWNNYKRSPFGQRQYSSERAWVRPARHVLNVGFEQIGSDPIIFWNGWKPILIGVPSPKDGRPSSQSDSDGTITYIRKTLNIDEFLKTCLDSYNENFCVTKETRKTKRFFVRRFVGKGGMRQRGAGGDDGGGTKISGSSPEINLATSIETGEIRILKWKNGDIGPDIITEKKALDALSFPPVVKEMLTELRHWLASEQWYRERQIPWTRGWMIFGPPGTGKTSLIRAIAQDYDLPVFAFDLASMNNEEFIRYWSEMCGNAPCIPLFEDMDGVFHGRKNITGDNGGGLSFDCFLNALSGIENANGIFKVMTTNDISKIDEALGIPRKDDHGNEMISTRPGRADRALELSKLDDTCRLAIAQRIMSDCPQYISRMVTEGNGDTGAQFQDRCSKIALVEHWKLKENQVIAEVAPAYVQTMKMEHAIEVAEMHEQLKSVSSDPNLTIGSSSFATSGDYVLQKLPKKENY
jgi:hypothetical protein